MQSTQGHDIGSYYVVIGFAGQRVFVGDGKYKLLKNLKSKNPNHLKSCNFVDTEIENKLEVGHKINDQMIYHALHKFNKSNKE